jgi:AraC-like DNA-binding protein
MIYLATSMNLSQSSKSARDPLTNVLDVIGAKVTRQTRMEAAGRWALAFPAIDRLKFIAMARGSGWILLPGQAPRLLAEGDVCVLGRTAYTIASEPEAAPIDGPSVYAAGCDVARLGGDDTIAIGGTVTFTTSAADYLLATLPEYMLVPRTTPGSGAVTNVLDLLNNEFERDAMGRGIVTARLGDVLLVEAIRTYADSTGSDQIGWLGASSDQRLGRVLRAVHADVAKPWTVAQLAGVAGMSRAAFSAEFSRRVGQPPLAYLRSWRLTLARATLSRSDVNVSDVASSVGYSSQSAFTYAYRRQFGVLPAGGRQRQ